MTTVTSYRNDAQQRSCQLVLDGGDKLALRIDADGLAIERLRDAAGPSELLYRGGIDQATEIAAALVSEESARPDAVLDVLVAAIDRLGSAERVKRAFKAAATVVASRG